MEFLTVSTFKQAESLLQAEVERFGRDKSFPVSMVTSGWETIWHDLVNAAIYRRGDIAEIGSTWLESLVAMQALHPFSPHEVNQIGPKEVFFPAAWQNIAAVNQKEVWGIPFRADARVIFYWKDMFENASVDASEAFSTPDKMIAAFSKLQQTGITPWIVPTDNTYNTVYNLASWIWGAGGDFLSPDGKRTDFGSPAAKRGIRAYFDLFRFMHQEIFPVSHDHVVDLFAERKAAATVAGPYIIGGIYQHHAEKFLPHLGAVAMPGPSFVGGTVLVRWQHSKHYSDAVELIKRLTGPAFQSEYSQFSGLLPVREDLWTDHFVNSNEYLSVFNQAIHKGRGLPPTPLWGMVEDRLSKTIGAIWQDLYALEIPRQYESKLDKILASHLDPLSARLDLTLSE